MNTKATLKFQFMAENRQAVFNALKGDACT
jgi:hypothetical protein